MGSVGQFHLSQLPQIAPEAAEQLQRLRLENAEAADALEQMLLATELPQRVKAAEALARYLLRGSAERRRSFPTSLPVGGIITPV